jgi:hypothetical protein
MQLLFRVRCHVQDGRTEGVATTELFVRLELDLLDELVVHLDEAHVVAESTAREGAMLKKKYFFISTLDFLLFLINFEGIKIFFENKKVFTISITLERIKSFFEHLLLFL